MQEIDLPAVRGTVRVTVPPNELFHKDEQFLVEAVRNFSVVVTKNGQNFVLPFNKVDTVKKDWVYVPCNHCGKTIAEVDKLTYVAGSARGRCRSCKKLTVIRGAQA
ncbi:hypothetical protein ACP26L_35970 (plasmid) [Paenibacillus sp. S-38]|uniref:hypothetical protein n=1 Tax=Paenibacillus sp. S-38 TaxID=3416710 RepID=UPI003CEBDAD1